MYYTIYKITNKINGKIYVGSHKTKNLDDGYMGSGKYLRAAIQKYGIENFDKEILHIFDNAKDMYNKEAEIVNEEFLLRENTYNLKIGGFGGFDYLNSWNENPIHSIEHMTKMSHKVPVAVKKEALNQARMVYQQMLEANNGQIWWTQPKGFLDKKHTDETKKIISKKLSVLQKGKNNSQYGTQWITDGINNKKIKKLDPIPEGWRQGRVIK